MPTLSWRTEKQRLTFDVRDMALATSAYRPFLRRLRLPDAGLSG